MILDKDKDKDKDKQTDKKYDNLKKLIITFISNGGLIIGACFHLYIAATIKKYHNLLSPTHPQISFKELITPLGYLLYICSVYELISGFYTIFSIFFLSATVRIWNITICFILSLITLLLSWTAPVLTLIIFNSWNNINNFQSTGFKLFTSIFVGNIKDFEYNFEILIITGIIVFLPCACYNVYYWIKQLLSAQNQNKNKFSISQIK